MSVWPRTNIWRSRLSSGSAHMLQGSARVLGSTPGLGLVVVKMIMLKFYNLSRQSQTHSREITNTFETRMWSTKVVVRRARAGSAGGGRGWEGQGARVGPNFAGGVMKNTHTATLPAQILSSLSLVVRHSSFYSASGWN